MAVSTSAPWINPNRRTIRAPVNTLDKSTVVSIYPKRIHEIKETIQPGVFDLAAGSYDKPAVLVVGPSSWWRELDEQQPLLEIPTSSVQIADSIVKDWASGLLASNGNDVMPGLFYVIGEFTSDQIKKDHKPLLDKALANQKRWYQELVNVGDILWARSNGNPLSISDDMRLAAQELNLKEKPWLADFTTVSMVNCVYCGMLIRPGFPVCSNCHHIVDPEMYKKMNPTLVSVK